VVHEAARLHILVGGAAAAFPLTARAQQPIRLIGVALGFAESIRPLSLMSQPSGLRSQSWGGRRVAISGSNFAGGPNVTLADVRRAAPEAAIGYFQLINLTRYNALS